MGRGNRICRGWRLWDSSAADPRGRRWLAARRREPARRRLGTYRPVETVLRAHPLRGLVQELCGRGQSMELRLEFLPAEDVVAYVAGRLGGPVVGPLAAFVHALRLEEI